MITSDFIQGHEKVLILDFGGQYAQLIGRRVRDLNVYCEVLPYRTSLERVKSGDYKAIIFTGGPRVFMQKTARPMIPRSSTWVFRSSASATVPN